MYCAIVVPYRVRIVIPESEMWEENDERPDYVLQNMVGAKIEFIIMRADMKSYVSELLEGYRARERKIAVLRYDLEHPSEVGVTEQIEAMNYGSGEGVGHSKGHISNKTLYIALNYEEQAKQLNAESAKEIADELFILERRQKKLLYYISLLEKRQAEVVRMVYMEGVSTKKAAEQHGLTVRTIERIRKDAVDNLAEMYAYSERYNG